MNEKQKVVRDFNVCNCNLSFFFILVLRVLEHFRGMYLKLKTSFSRSNCYIPQLILNYISELILNYISPKTKSKSHMNIWELKNITKWKIKRSALMLQELLNLEYFWARFNHATETLQIIKLSNFLHVWIF